MIFMPMQQIPVGQMVGSSRASDAAGRAIFSTHDLAPSKQFDAYQSYCSPVIEIALNDEARAGFDATCDMWTLGGLVLRHIRVPAGDFARTARQIRRDGLDHWVVNVARRGRQIARTAMDQLATDAGVPSVFSLAGPYQAQPTEIDWLGVFIPRGTVPALDAGLRHDRHILLDNSRGRLLAAHLKALVDELPSMTRDDTVYAAEATKAIVVACATPTKELRDDAHPHVALPRILRVQTFIDRHLGTWTLQPDMICKAVEVSRSNLYRLFEPYGGVAQYIQRRRLRRVHDQLADPDCTQTITSIATDFCFADSTTLSRAFRREFGCSPSDVRRLAGSGLIRPVHHTLPKPDVRRPWDVLYRV
jgi:AraC-like DNA-binding protein